METPNDAQPPQGEAIDAEAFQANVAANLARFAAEGAGGETGATDTPPGPPLPAWAPPRPNVPEADPFAATEPLSMEQQAEAMDRPAARPEDYEVPGMHASRHDDHAAFAEGLEEVRGLQSLLWHAGLPAAEGSSILFEIAEAARRAPHDELNDVDFQLQTLELHKSMRQLLGDAEFERQFDALATLTANVRQSLPPDKREAFDDYLDDTAHLITGAPLAFQKLLAHAGRGRKR